MVADGPDYTAVGGWCDADKAEMRNCGVMISVLSRKQMLWCLQRES